MRSKHYCAAVPHRRRGLSCHVSNTVTRCDTVAQYLRHFFTCSCGYHALIVRGTGNVSNRAQSEGVLSCISCELVQAGRSAVTSSYAVPCRQSQGRWQLWPLGGSFLRASCCGLPAGGLRGSQSWELASSSSWVSSPLSSVLAAPWNPTLGTYDITRLCRVSEGKLCRFRCSLYHKTGFQKHCDNDHSKYCSSMGV